MDMDNQTHAAKGIFFCLTGKFCDRYGLLRRLFYHKHQNRMNIGGNNNEYV